MIVGKRVVAVFVLVVVFLLLIACSASVCYPPNKIFGNKCCLDEDNNAVCDYEEKPAPEEPEDNSGTDILSTADADDEKEMPANKVSQKDAPEIRKISVPEPEPITTGLVLGKQKVLMGEQREYIQLNELSAYRSSTDKGVMDYMVYTVRNIGNKKLAPAVELFFEPARVRDKDVKLKKEYFLEPLEPGEKLVINQSLGISFGNIDTQKKIILSVYERYSFPQEDLKVLEKKFMPEDYMASSEIFIFGPSEQ